MPRACCVENCSHKWAPEGSFLLPFPKDQAKRKKWLSHKQFHVRSSHVRRTFESLRICSRHFALDAWKKAYPADPRRRRLYTLKENACPTIFPRLDERHDQSIPWYERVSLESSTNGTPVAQSPPAESSETQSPPSDSSSVFPSPTPGGLCATAAAAAGEVSPPLEMSQSKMSVEQLRKLQSELAAEEMKLTIMKQMRQSQQNQLMGHSFSTSQGDPGHPPSLQRSREPLHPTPSSSASARSHSSSNSSSYRSQSSHGHETSSPIYHRRPHHSGSSQRHHFGNEPMDYRDYPGPPDMHGSNGLPPPPPLRQLGRRKEREHGAASPRTVPSGRDSPPSLMPRSQLEMERHSPYPSSRQGTATPPMKNERAAATNYTHPHVTGQARGRHSPSMQAAGAAHHSSSSSHQREYMSSSSHYRSSSQLAPAATSKTSVQPDQEPSQEAMLHKVASRLNQLYAEREHFMKVYIPNKPPQYTWSLVPAALSLPLLSLIGMDECVRRVESARTGVPLPDPEKMSVLNRPVCAHCKSDFAPFWRSFEDDNKMVIVCENCDWARVKRPFVQQHAVRLKECIPKVEALSEEMERLQRSAGVSVVPVNRLPAR